MRKTMNTMKRATALVLTTALVLGLSVSVYAAEEIEAVEAAEAAADTETPAGEEATVENTGAAQLIDAALESVSEETPVAAQLNAGAALVDETAANLDGAAAQMGTAVEAAAQADAALEAEAGYAVDLVDFGAAVTETTNDVNAAIQAAESVKNAENKEAAKAAADNAQANLNNAEAKLQNAENALADAENRYDSAKAAADAAEAKISEAKTAVANAEAALNDAKTNSTAALESLKAAKALVASMEREKNELDAIKNQYYAMMVYYYRTKNAAVYNTDGSLNITGSAGKLSASAQNALATSPDNSLKEMGRYLAEQLVSYMILNGENVDRESAAFTFGQGENMTTKAVQGTVFVNANRQDQTVASGSKRDINGKTVTAGETKYYDWQNTNVANDDGRGRHVKVTYKDKDGVEHTEYYNYIIKAAKNGETDLENGTIYMALVKQNEEGKWEATRVENNDNNYDDYQKLTAALDALNAIEDYEAAKAAVDAAEAKVADLQAQIAALKNVTVDETKLAALKDALAAAEADLDAAKIDKAALEEAVAAARAVVAAIDLSGFDKKEETAVAAEAEEEIRTAGSAPAATAPVTIVSVTDPVEVRMFDAAPVAATASAPAATEETVIADALLPGAAAPTTAAEKEEEVVPAAEEKAEEVIVLPATDSVALGEDALPGFAGFAGQLLNLWWIIVLILAAIAYVVYNYYRNHKKEAC